MDEALDRLWKMHFSLPPQDLDWEGKPLSRSERKLLARVLHQFDEPRSVRPIIQSHAVPEDLDRRIAQLRQKIHKDYDGVDLGTEPPKYPTVRGPYGR